MRKILVVAIREYNAAVRTKAFLIGLLIMPLMMGGSLIIQRLLRDFRDTAPKKFAVIDRTPGEKVLKSLEQAVKAYNAQTRDPSTNKQVKPEFILERIDPPRDNPEAVNALRQVLSDRVRKGDLFGFIEIGPAAASFKKPDDASKAEIRYQSQRPAFGDFSDLATRALTPRIQQLRCWEADLPPEKVAQAIRPVLVQPLGLTTVTREGVREDSRDSGLAASMLIPGGLMMLMFMMIFSGSAPLMQGVVEEKMQRIAEVLLGSIPPFSLMLGKILGMTAVSLTIGVVYLGGTYWAAHHWGLGESLPLSLVAWFVFYQILASLMYGSLFIAVGAACTDMKETQNLLWPVMLLATLPLFVLGSVLNEPNSSVVTALSFFPFSTPMLMVARQAVPPGIPLWQPIVGAVVVLATTLACVWAAGRIFRVGLLMQGKGASLGEMVRWVFRG